MSVMPFSRRKLMVSSCNVSILSNRRMHSVIIQDLERVTVASNILHDDTVLAILCNNCVRSQSYWQQLDRPASRTVRNANPESKVTVDYDCT